MITLKHIPFTYHWIVRNAIGENVKTVLDLGCGEGDFMRDIAEGENWDITGIELYTASLKKAAKTGAYKKVVKGDIVKLPKSVSGKKYDVVFASQVLEHLKKSDGNRVLKTWLKMAKKRLVITTPVGFIEYEPIEKKEEDNPLQKHLSGWEPGELASLGFDVRGQGAKFVYGKNGFARMMSFILPFWSLVALLFGPLVYLHPDKGLYMIAVKKIN